VIDEAVAAVRAGKTLIIPTDTVYGLCVDAYRADPAERLARLKRRPPEMPMALLAADVDALFDAIPEARGRVGVIARALLPGPFTLVIPNPARRFRWLTGTRPETIGVRVADLPARARAVVERAGALAATSANLHGEPDPRRIEDIPAEIRDAAAVVLDAGELPGTPSTVIDLTAAEPSVLREGAVPADEALARVAAAV
jgi:L-threonylcarbamoyladenylate synthase